MNVIINNIHRAMKTSLYEDRAEPKIYFSDLILLLAVASGITKLRCMYR